MADKNRILKTWRCEDGTIVIKESEAREGNHKNRKWHHEAVCLTPDELRNIAAKYAAGT